MPTNVTQKDQTLQAVIDYCQRKRDRLKAEHHVHGDCYEQYEDAAWNGGQSFALLAVIDYCKDMLGYSGSIPLEVENQSEDAK